MNELQIYGINWYGMEEQPTGIMEGLWQYSLEEHLTRMKDEHFNTIRIPFCLESILHHYYDMPVSLSLVEACNECVHDDQQPKTPFEILHELFMIAQKLDIKIILDLHRLRFKTTDPLWYNRQMTETDFIEGWNVMLDKYSIYPNLLGIDLYNEPHGIVSFDDNNSLTDWKLASVRLYEALNPKLFRPFEPLLLFINGIGWGQDMRLFPSAEDWFLSDDANQYIVMSPHAYGPTLTPEPELTKEYLYYRWEHYFGHLIEKNWTVVIGEWGGNENFQPDRDWMTLFVNYLVEKNVRMQCFWAWNPNSKDVKGYLLPDWKTPSAFKKDLLQRLLY